MTAFFETGSFFHISPGPTGIKGATDQMLPWKAPNDPKTLPMGILHDYMSCWATLGPFRYPRGPQNGPKQHRNGPEWLKITRMAQNGTAWPQMTLNTSHGYITWLYVMLDHPGPFSEAHGGPIMAQSSTKNGPSWPKMALHDPKWSCMTPNGLKILLTGMLHESERGSFLLPSGTLNKDHDSVSPTRMSLHCKHAMC